MDNVQYAMTLEVFCDTFDLERDNLRITEVCTDTYLVDYLHPNTGVIITIATKEDLNGALIELAMLVCGYDYDDVRRCVENAA